MPKVKYSKEIILEKAMDRAEKLGIRAIAVRDIAADIGCSVAPIYTAFGSLDGLIQEVKEGFIKLLMEYTTRTYSQDTFLNIGIGAVRYALDYPNIYRYLFLEDTDEIDDELYERNLLNILYDHPLKDWLSKEELENIMLKMDVFTQGLCAQIVLGNKTKLTLEKCETLLSQMGHEMLIGVLVKNGKYEQFVKAMTCYDK